MKNTTLVRNNSVATKKPRKSVRGSRSMRLESLEIRDLLAANTLDFVDNLEIASPGDTRDMQLEVAGNSGTGIVALRIKGTSGNLDPAIPLVFIQDTDRNNPANHVPLMQAYANSSGTLDSLVLFQVSAGQNFTIQVGGTSGAGGFLAEVMHFGSIDNNGTVSENEYMRAVAAELQARGAGNHNTAMYFQTVYGINFNESQYNPAFDANMNGRVDGWEVGYVEANKGRAPLIVDLIGDNEAPAVQASVAVDTGVSASDNLTNDLTGITGVVTDFSTIVSAQVSIQGGSGGSIDLVNNPSISSLVVTNNQINFTLGMSDLDALLGSTVENSGPQTLLITTMDELGNTSITPFSLDFEFDTAAPVAPTGLDLDAASDSGESDADDLTNDTTPTLSVTAEAGSSVTFVSSIDGVLGTVVANASGIAVFTPTTGLTEGSHDITTTATDDAGNTGTASAALSIVIDTVAPADVTGIVLDNQTGNANLTDADEAAFSATTEANALVEIRDSNSIVVASKKADGSGNVSFSVADFDIDLALGENNFTFVATDAAGNASGQAAFTVFRNTPPTITPGQFFNVDENAPNTTSVGGVVADGNDTGDTLSYAITGIDVGYEGAFAIDAATGQITVADVTKLNFEDKTSFTVEIQVTDSFGDGLGGAGLVATQTVTINVNDVNEAPTFDQENYTFEVEENSAAMTVVDSVSASDVDADDTSLTYGISGGTGAGLFDIDTATGEISVISSGTLNFEDKTSYTLDVTVTDTKSASEVGIENTVTKTITINLIDVNEAPVITSDATVDLAENSANGTLVATVTASDVDADDPPFLFEITGGTGENFFSIDPASGEVRVTDESVLNFENPTNSFTLEIRVTDNLDGDGAGEVGSQLSDNYTLTINLTDENDAPTAVPGTVTLEIDENSDASTEVTTDGSTAAVLTDYFDDEDGDNLTFSIVGGDPNGAFTISGNNIVVDDASLLDFEATQSFTLTVRATDDGTGMLTAEKEITVNVINLNELPPIPGGTVTLPNVSLLDVDDAGDVGSFSLPIGLVDPEGDLLTYSDGMSGQPTDANGYFQLNADGTITLLQVLSPTDLDMNGERTFTIEFYVDDDNSTLTDDPDLSTGPYTLTFKVTDNEAPVFTLPNGTDFDIAENVDGSVMVNDSLTPAAVFEASDPEGDAFTFSLAPSASNSSAALAGLFQLVLVDDKGNMDASDDRYEVVVANATDLTFDFVNANGGTNGEFTIDLVVEDTNNRITTQTITITVSDENNTPTFIAPAGVNVDEFVETKTGSLGANSGDEVYTLSNAFADIDAASNLSYTIDSAVVTGTSTDISGAFKIENGKIVVNNAALLDVEGIDPDSITLTITANDGQGEANSTVTGDITIAVNPRNELPIFTTPTANFDVAFKFVDGQDMDDLTNLGNISSVLNAMDPEGDGIEFAQRAMAGTGSDYFALGTDGTISLIQAVPDVDFTNQERIFTLVFDYSDDPTMGSLDSNSDLEFSDGFTLTIRVFQNPPATFDQMNYDFTLDENTAAGSTVVQTVSATDPEGETVTYTINDPSGTFVIDENTGEITIDDNAALDFETNTSITFTVNAVDAVNNITPMSITVTISDVNEAPEISNMVTEFGISEDASNNDAVGTVTVDDPDAGDSFTYAIVSGNDDGVFQIDGSGNITIADNSSIDFESTPSYSLEIKVTDNGGPTAGTNKLFDTQTFTVTVGDINEAPVLTGSVDLPIVDESDLDATEIGTENDAFYTKFYSNAEYDFHGQFTDPEGDELTLSIANIAAIEALDYVQSISYDNDPTTGGLTITFVHYATTQDRSPFQVQFDAVETSTSDMFSANAPLMVDVEATNQKAVDFRLIPVASPTNPDLQFSGISEGQLPTGITRIADNQTFTVEVWGTTLIGQDDVTPGYAWAEGFQNVLLSFDYDTSLVSTSVSQVFTPLQILGTPIVENGEVYETQASFGQDETLPAGVTSRGYKGEYVRLMYINFTVNDGIDLDGLTLEDLVSIDLADLANTQINLNGSEVGDDPSNPNFAGTTPDVRRDDAFSANVIAEQTDVIYPNVEIVDAVTFTVSVGESNAIVAVGPNGSKIGGAEVTGQFGVGQGNGNLTGLTGEVYVVFDNPSDPTSLEIIGGELTLTDISGKNFRPGEPTTSGGDPLTGSSDGTPANFGLLTDVPNGDGNVTTVQTAVRETTIRIAGSPSISLTGDSSAGGGATFDSSSVGLGIASGFADIMTLNKSTFDLGSERNTLEGDVLASTGVESSTLVSNASGTAHTLTLNLARLLDRAFSVDGNSIDAEIFYNSVVTLDAGGGVPLQGTAFVKDGQPLEDGSGVFVTVNKERSQTNANGEVSILPDSAEWASEWDSLWIEVWGNTADAAGVYGGTVDLGYNTSLYTATQIEYASSMSTNRTGIIDDATGTITGLGSQTSQTDLGNGSFVLLGRVKLEALPSDAGININIDEDFEAESLGLTVDNAKVMLTSIGTVDADITSTADVDIWGVAYDVNDDGKISLADYGQFVTAYGRSSLENNDGLVAALDFDNNGKVGLSDFGFFVQNYGKNKADGSSLIYPEQFTRTWLGSNIELDGPDTLQQVFDKAVSDWQDALGWEEPIDVKLVVKDFGDAQLGEAELLQLDENGLPQFGILTLDDDGAGLGWSSDLDGGPAEGQYDLYTVILHELGHLYGFMSHYVGFSDNVVTDHEGNKIFVGADFVAMLDDYAHHLDSAEHAGDVMNATLDPGQRKLISALDVQILETAYASASADHTLVTGGTAALHAATTSQTIVEELPSVAQTPVVTESTNPVSFVFDNVVDVETVSGRHGLEAPLAPAVYNELIRNGVRVTTTSSAEVQQQMDDIDSAVATLAVDGSELLLADSVQEADYFATEDDSTNVDDLFADWDFDSDLDG